MKVILQHDERDCGAACLAMIARHYGLKITLAKCRELTKTDRMGTNLYGLIDGAKKIGLKGQALKGTLEELLEEIENNKITLPFIAHFGFEDIGYHFVVVKNISNRRFVIFDPGKGKYKLDRQSFDKKWTGFIASFIRDVDFSFDKRDIWQDKKYFQLLKKQYLKLFTIFILSFFIAAVGIGGSYIFKVILDNITGTGTQDYLLIKQQYNIIFLSIICLYIFQMFAHFIRGQLIIEVSKNIDVQLMLNYYYHILRLPVSSISLRQTGEYISRFSDAGIIRDMVSSASVTVVLDATTAIGCGYIIFAENNRLFLLAVGMIVLYALIILLYRKPLRVQKQITMEKNANLQSLYKECIDGIETIKASGALDIICKKIKDRFNVFINNAVCAEKIQLSQEALIGGIELIGTTVILWDGFMQVYAGNMSIGTLITCYALLGYFIEPVKNLIGLQPQVQSAIIAAERLEDIFELQEENDTASLKPNISYEHWELNDVCFRYGNRRLILDHINISVKRGEKIAIVGESGGGKTTIAKLLLKFYMAEDGTILVDSVPIQDISTAEIRKKVAYVNQNTFLFSDSILNNICMENQDATEEEVVELCKACHIDSDIKKFPHGYQTILDENGANLSGGQRQRIAIVRAFLKNPDLIILDEATSNLDSETENTIKQLIDNKGKNMACIIITHRLSIIKECNRVYVLGGGKVLESGSHDELLLKKGKYYQYWNK